MHAVYPRENLGGIEVVASPFPSRFSHHCGPVVYGLVLESVVRLITEAQKSITGAVNYCYAAPGSILLQIE
jgi:hypothetical protein